MEDRRDTDPMVLEAVKDGKVKALWSRSRKCGVFLALLVVVFIGTILIGTEVEKANVRKAPSTLYFYETPAVCGVHSAEKQVVTHVNASEAGKAGDLVAHCGDCGFCSNYNDIEIYNTTKETLTKTSTNCATKAFIGGSDAVFDCFKEDVGFTDGCNDCWTENVMCDMKKCVFTCLKMIMTGQRNNGGDGKLNDCLLCDEKLCGPAFIECAGANRRRSGIISDIGRDDENEVCDSVNAGWRFGLE
ncbi:hypothetical protein TL16_g10659 [Triparma laevis f. inornata]|uniref:Uncharacterized protein n=2 Tax=Triparma laevis TaxID=1534972 RepID=A0A9W6ZXB8_9STRA|nr:hypothetical protein TrLO_g13373 [Triparma laevis f. longispina]GMH86803.1 hypothetical protein TL16_g10659 [Triparma laevis f. inornata]